MHTCIRVQSQLFSEMNVSHSPDLSPLKTDVLMTGVKARDLKHVFMALI